jgi:hypothetical protein
MDLFMVHYKPGESSGDELGKRAADEKPRVLLAQRHVVGIGMDRGHKVGVS